MLSTREMKKKVCPWELISVDMNRQGMTKLYSVLLSVERL